MYSARRLLRDESPFIVDDAFLFTGTVTTGIRRLMIDHEGHQSAKMNSEVSSNHHETHEEYASNNACQTSLT